ncbi:hypothetical protein Skr01_55970 [Sphaerisporangium krabiense]|uniref:Uncharacterized protein n=1 Tax=Sphaerisporangium krabiense TaxID=763782 RepID=A0A7W9DUW1_9ACTN|nr:hypothetical protein [Sphaerisporangium krabiense]MBB5630805.1 hypothetical protein [Sphaerisporangium krabiense]GII65512.1 hypothetical protein Skr01_55970 [Sphaerisporangium krabiense]
MSDEKLSLPELAVLVALMREAREVSNADLEEKYGLRLDGKRRVRLNDMKLVETRKEGRVFVHMLTDDGWSRMRREIGAGLRNPQITKSPKVLVEGLAAGLFTIMERTGHSLADVFAPSPDPAPEPSPVPEPGDVEGRIRAAYRELANEPGAWVGIAEIRSHLGDVPRAEVDEALRAMNRMDGVSLVPDSNNKVLTEKDREAAVTIGDQDKHLIWIGA